MPEAVRVYGVESRRLRRLLIGLGIVMTLMLAAERAWQAVAGRSLAALLSAVAGLVFVWLIVIPLLWRGLHKSLRGQSLQIGPSGVVRRRGGEEQVVAWGEITGFQVRGSPEQPRTILVSTAAGEALDLGAFERPGEILGLVRSGIGPGVPVELK